MIQFIYRNIKCFIFLLSLYAIVLIHPQSINASLLLNETFDNLDIDYKPLGWSIINSYDKWIVENISGDNKLTGTFLPYTNDGYIYTGSSSWTNYSLEAELTGLSGPDRFLFFRYDFSRPMNRRGYMLKYVENDIYESRIELWGLTNPSCLIVSNKYTSHINQTHKIKVELINNEIHVFFDNILIFNCLDSNPILTGYIGFYNQKSGHYVNGIPVINKVAYDNIKVTSINSFSNVGGLLELPISYEGRLEDDENKFKSAFWERMTAVFDHQRINDSFINFTGSNYNRSDCPRSTYGIKCYDTHNGTDFSTSGLKKMEVLAAAEGNVVFASERFRENGNDKCKPNKGGYGCVVILEHPDPNIYTLYAHLKSVDVNKDEFVDQSTKLGVMGKTGCEPECGQHLHFSVLKPVNSSTSEQINNMGTKDWEELLYLLQPEKTTVKKSYCRYVSPSKQIFTFIDPSGWKMDSTDPWSIIESENGCGIENKYLWKYDVGTSKPLSLPSILPLGLF